MKIGTGLMKRLAREAASISKPDFSFSEVSLPPTPRIPN